MFLAPAEGIVLRAMAAEMDPPPPPDPNAWAERWISFDDGSPFPGPYQADRFPFFRRILEVLSPEHPAREVSLRGSAQFGKTETIMQAALGSWFDQAPQPVLVVQPTGSAAKEWVQSKWLPMRRRNERLRALFGSAANIDSLFYQETLDRRCSLKVVSAGSPSDLSGTTRPRVCMDDLSKFEATPQGDPEQLAISRASAFEEAKILRTSTPMLRGSCRITTAYERGTMEVWEVPCPHCGDWQELEWETLRRSIDPANPAGAHFICESCGAAIEHKHKTAIVSRGRWRAKNPKGDHPSFHLWRALMPHRDWASIAVEWLQAEGDAAREQTFWNDVLGLPYEAASDAPVWTELRDRAENAGEDGLDLGRIPAGHPILAAGVDCQGDRIEVHVRAFGREGRSWTVDYRVIPHHVGDDEGRAALDRLLETRWRNVAGRDLALDRLAIDGNAYTDDVWEWAKRHPWSRVIIVRGGNSAIGPIYALQKFERRRDGKVKKRQKRAYTLNTSALKIALFADLKKEDPGARGFVGFARGLGDAFYRMLCSEARVTKRNRWGVMESAWKVVSEDGRNEALDTAIYADVAARICGWKSNTDADWDRLEAERDSVPEAPQGDLFDRPVAAVAQPVTEAGGAGTPGREAPAAKPAAPESGGQGAAALFAKLKRG